MRVRIFSIAAFLLVLASSCNQNVTKEADEYFMAGDYQNAIISYSEYLATKPKHIKSLYNRGRAYEELGFMNEARQDFEKVLEIDPENINANMSAGKWWYNERNFNRAIYYFDKVIQVDGRVASAYLYKGRSLHQKGDFEEARENYDQAINFDNKDGEAFLYRGALKIAMNQKTSACNDFNRAKALGNQEAGDALTKYCK